MHIRSLFRAAGIAAVAGGLLLGQVANQPKPKSQKEADAVMAIFNAQDPDSRIAAAENLLTKFADTEFKVVALQVAAASAQQKNDFEKMVIYAERTLEADPKNYPSMLMLATGLAQRTREFDLDKEDKLKKATSLATQAMELLKAAPKPRPDITDEQWEGAKKEYSSQGFEALGLVAMARKQYDEAAKQFKQAVEISATPDQSTMARLGAAYLQGGKPDEAIVVFDKLLATADIHPAIKEVATREKANAQKLKASGAKPATSAAPPQVEVKKP
jgi:tetratricopeptide (TPR) repeat protein